jgi:hypothetical protein
MILELQCLGSGSGNNSERIMVRSNRITTIQENLNSNTCRITMMCGQTHIINETYESIIKILKENDEEFNNCLIKNLRETRL